MKKRIAIKIIGGAIIFSFAMFFLGSFLPLKASAATTNKGLNWENPNKNGNNPYKFKPADVLNSQLIMQVVGCTGVVDKVSAAVVGFVQGKAGKVAAAALKQKTMDQITAAAVKACQSGKKITMGGVAGIPNLSLTDVVNLTDCKPIQKTADGQTVAAIVALKQDEAAAKTRDECFNGIAITLARNQLTAMTRYTMNWVNSGFSGNPMYVQDITRLTNKISQDALNAGVLELTKTDKAYPYGASFSTAIINNYKSEGALKNGANNFLANMTSTLNNFVTDPQSYKFTSTIKDKRTAAQKAKDLNKSFANDFSLGGWSGYLGLTMNEANNPLGFSMAVSQYLTDQAEEKKAATKNEVAQNNGFLSQKKCSLYNDLDKELLISKLSWLQSEATNACKDAVEVADCLDAKDLVKQKQYEISNFQRTCVTWDVVTPGSLIKDKVSTYVNSPERQLELADTINKSLNSLFTALITKFQDQGLSGLSSEKYQYTSTSMGGGPGSDSIDLFSDATGGSGYTNGSFDLTHDLGNRFIHGYKIDSVGNWNAKINEPQLSIGVAPLMDDGKTPWEPNVFYTVKNGVDSNGKGIVGQTKLFENGYNNWENGDRAFWDGTEWQNWKKTTVDKNGIMLNTSPIAKRGVIQIQKDYVVAAKQILASLPIIMPQIGELDYCLPGPNPNFQGISADTSALFSDFSGSVTAEFKKGSLFKRKSNTYSIATFGDPQFDDYYNVFKLTDYTWWQKVTQTDYWNRLQAYGNAGTVKGSQKNLDNFQQGIDDLLEKINTDTKIFYDVYAQYIDKAYGPNSLMQTQFFKREDTPDLIPNPAWLPMASEGLDITKDIVAYNDDIITTANDYKDSIIKADANVSKLSEIKNKVSAIIIAAQKRRNDKLIATLKQEAIDSKGPILTEAQYKEKYKNCLAEEQIVYYDDLSIMGTPNDEKNRCSDGLDNDLDGLVDDLDPDCNGNKVIPPPNYTCVTDLTDYPATEDDPGGIFIQNEVDLNLMPEDTPPCTTRTASTCTSSLYFSGGMGMKCRLP
ncbi:MAG: hypothetical protein WCW04_02685 [Candidatus Paceibacterota bacterium]